MQPKYDYIIIGAGIVGLATARELQQRYSEAKILLLEKEAEVAKHQTGHNSGVIHAGVYYQPGSLKADFCKRGHQQTIAFCQAHQLPYEQCGKLLVATNRLELKRMYDLYERCQENQIEVELIDQNKLRELEPNISGLGAIKVSATGIVNYRAICQKLAELFIADGGELKLEQAVRAIEESAEQISVSTTQQSYQASMLVVCAGLMADRLCQLQGLETNFQIVPYRGEYYQLPPRLNQLISHLIYPIPDPELPFLGVHLTKMIDGSITVGPNAVQGWSREGYAKGSVDLQDLKQMLSFPGFWKVAKQHFKSGLIETKNSLFKSGYLETVRKYCPRLTVHDLQPYPAGIRAQAVLRDGTLVHDFLFEQSARALHVCNAPSPAATSAFPIASYLADKTEDLSRAL